MRKKRKHIELFAGCGGMAVGMEAADFELVFANEVSPMASATFAHNLLGVDISEPNEKVKWIHTQFSKNEYKNRLRENLLFNAPNSNSELVIDKDLDGLKGKLLVGDVRKLRDLLRLKNINNPYKGKLDLLSGGPPCQSFSLAGKRELTNYKNRLPLDFAEVCEILKPKVVLLENVKGILAPFTENREKHHAWFEVSKAFAQKGYAPLCMLINSKYFGIAQNRPRFIMLAFREDIWGKIKDIYNNEITENVNRFYSNASNGIHVNIGDFKYYDIEKNRKLFNGNLLPNPISFEKNKWVGVSQAIADFSSDIKKSSYVNYINERFSLNRETVKIVQNHNPRSHSVLIKNRFKLYSLLNACNGEANDFIKLLHSKPEGWNKKHIIRLCYDKIAKTYKMNQFEVISSFENWIKFLSQIEFSKKHSQRSLKAGEPSPAQLTIPDDICHYSPNEARVLTVREIARIQSFPDWFEFKSKETTGGKKRSYEVPQYTQVGNAVPPLLAYSLGRHVNKILTKIGE